MAKRYRSPEHQGRAEAQQGSPSMETGLDNNLLLQQLSGGASADMAEVAQLTAPRVERAMLALSLQARSPSEVDRFTHILERSALAPDRRGELVLRLQQNQALAAAVGDAVARFFGTDTPALRDELVRSLDGVWQGLARGSHDGEEWTVGERQVPLSEETRSGSEFSRSDALLTDLSGVLSNEPTRQAADGAGHQAGPALAALVRSIQGLVGLDEEEEEDAVFAGFEQT